MQQILYLLLGCYLLPLAGMIASAITSKLFQTDSSLVMMVAAISDTFLGSIRTGLATILIPMITAYAVELRRPEDDVPLEKLRVIRLLFAAFVLSFALNGVILSQQDRLIAYSAQVAEAFKNTSVFYTHELLSYISIAIVVVKIRGPKGPHRESRIFKRLPTSPTALDRDGGGRNWSASSLERSTTSRGKASTFSPRPLRT